MSRMFQFQRRNILKVVVLSGAVALMSVTNASAQNVCAASQRAPACKECKSAWRTASRDYKRTLQRIERLNKKILSLDRQKMRKSDRFDSRIGELESAKAGASEEQVAQIEERRLELIREQQAIHDKYNALMVEVGNQRDAEAAGLDQKRSVVQTWEGQCPPRRSAIKG